MEITHQIIVLLSILAIGAGLGQIKVRGVSLGTAGVLFVALFFGHAGQTVPRVVMELGLIMFVYAVGLQAGPRFFQMFRQTGIQFTVAGVCSVLAGAAVTVALAKYLNLPYDLASGIYAGAMTCTPAMAAAIDAVSRIGSGGEAHVSVGYGLAYPFAMISLVLLMHFLPRLLRRDPVAEENRWRAEQHQEASRLVARQFMVANPNCFGRTVREINPSRMTLVNISRVRRGEQVLVARPDLVLQSGDVVMAVGPEEELKKMRLLLGEETEVAMDVNANVLSIDVEVSERAIAGKRIADLHVWTESGVVITRVRRDGSEITPTGNLVLEMGDVLRVVGEKGAIEGFSRKVGTRSSKSYETSMATFLGGLLIGALVGSVPLGLPGGPEVRLGIAGGAFVTSLVIGYFGRIGPFRLYVPQAAKGITRELGLMLFLAGAGTSAGARLMSVVHEQGLSLFLAGVLVTTVSVTASVFVTHVVYRMNLFATMGALSAAMTNPPALGAANAKTDIDLPTMAYASVYPVALIIKIMLGQTLVEVLWRTA